MNNELRFHWDEDEQLFVKKQVLDKFSKNDAVRVEDYLDFLSEIGLPSDCLNRVNVSNKKFIL